ncbi:MAG: diguanylate cyclase [Candidatus Aminicenantes bacterium]|nr:diguanylate cyclase [Candidatus Aminicenantes bacterium]
MDVVKCLILSPNPLDRIAFPDLCRDLGTVRQAGSVEAAAPELQNDPPDVLIAEQSLGDFGHYEGRLSPRTSVLLTGPDERAARETIVAWPAEFFLDYVPRPQTEPEKERFRRTLSRAVEHARLKSEEKRLKEIYSEILEIKGFIGNNVIRELEKRVALQVRYLWFQRKKQKIEDILRKIYMANDVNSLLDTLPDIKDLVQASGITFYVLDENETLGKYLKPLVWDDAFLSHTEFSRYIALLDSEDFASQVVRSGEEVNITRLPPGRKPAKRYVEHLKVPLRSLLDVPIRHEKKIIGVLEVINKLHKGAPSKLGFTAEDSQILRGISEHISLAMTKLNLIHYDALTGILRPDPFFDKVIQKIRLRSKRRQEIGSHAMVMGDVDWFKHYNDRNGHEAGNRLLRQLAGVLKASIREDDLLCRYGGEEFLFFLAGVNSLEEACILTERIRKNIEETYFENEETQPRNNLTMSFGVTLLPKKEEFYASINRYELKKIANEADMALAEAKGKRFTGSRPEGEGGQRITKNKVCAYQRENAGQGKTEAVINSYRQEFFAEKRKTPRHYISTLLLYQENGDFKVTRTINLSLGGLRMMSDARLPMAKSLDLFLVLEDKAASLKGDVVYSRKADEETAQFHTGIRFREMAAADRKALENFLMTTSKRESSA